MKSAAPNSLHLILSEEQYSRLVQVETFIELIEVIFEFGKAQSKFFRKKICEETGLQSSYWSQVLNQKTKLSPETFLNFAGITGLSEPIILFGLKLQAIERAGSERLRSVLRRELEQSRSALASLNERLSIREEVSESDQWKYVSSWLPAAVHMLSFLPEAQTSAGLAKRLSLPEERVKKVQEELHRMGLLEKSGSRYRPSVRQIHFPPDSDFARRQHANWRTESARRVLEDRDESALRFSSVLCGSRKDLADFRRKIENAVADLTKRIPDSPEEDVMVFACDFLGL